jgi:O-antigen ligase
MAATMLCGVARMIEKNAILGRFRAAAPVEQWLAAIIAISAVPLVQGLLTTTLDGNITLGQAVVRIFSLVTIIANIFIINIAMRNGFSFIEQFNDSKTALFILFSLLTLAIMSIFAEHILFLQASFITIRYLLQVVTLFALIFVIKITKTFDINKYVFAMICGSLAYIAYIIFIALLVTNPTFVWEAALPSATSIRHIGNYVAIFSIVAMASFLFMTGRAKWAGLAAVFVIIAFLGWTGCRAAFLGIGVALVISIIATRRHVSSKRVGILAVTLVAATLSATVFPAPGPSFGVIRMINASDARQRDSVSSHRTDLWIKTMDEIAAAPLLGHGAGRYANNMYDKYGYDVDNPHNFFLQFAYDWGFIGLGLALILIAIGGISLIRLPVVSPIATFCAISGLTLMLTIGMLEGMFYHPMKMLLVSALVAPAFGMAQRQKAEQIVSGKAS